MSFFFRTRPESKQILQIDSSIHSLNIHPDVSRLTEGDGDHSGCMREAEINFAFSRSDKKGLAQRATPKCQSCWRHPQCLAKRTTKQGVRCCIGEAILVRAKTLALRLLLFIKKFEPGSRRDFPIVKLECPEHDDRAFVRLQVGTDPRSSSIRPSFI